MKKVFLIMSLLAAPFANSETLNCSLSKKLNSNSPVVSFKLDRDLDAGLEFAVVSFESRRPEIVHYKSEAVRHFTDWSGHGTIIQHTYQQPARSYPDPYVIEIAERIGGHQFEKSQTLNGSYSIGGVRYGIVECLKTESNTSQQDPIDSCMLDCGRPCMDRPVFCGKW